ncbi:MAG: biotin--[acetyl-CoA-carboxylase] ligase [Elusimicrobiota bacterium]|nr:biotin--[acetyl-CoA-carboxylase] ligase [Elusimicrobiota bacterium]
MMSLDKKNDELNIDTLQGIRKIIFVDEAVSTQDMAREISGESDMENSLIMAEQQTEGKGRLGSPWSSEKGGIYMTLVLKPKIECRFLEELSLFSGEVIASALASFYDIKTRVKKPNDVYAYHPKKKKYMKIAGVLTTSSSTDKNPDWILLGMGININNQIPRNLSSSAVSIKQLSGSAQDRGKFLKYFFEMFWKEYAEWQVEFENKSA